MDELITLAMVDMLWPK